MKKTGFCVLMSFVLVLCACDIPPEVQNSPAPMRYTQASHSPGPSNDKLRADVGEQASVSPGPWNDKLKADVDEATLLADTDPVSSLLLFKNVLERKEDGPTQRQAEWLRSKIDGLHGKAINTLQTDFDEAGKVGDLRTMLITCAVADKIGKDALKTQPALAEVKNRVFAGSPDAGYVWTVSVASAAFVRAPYTEGSSSSRLTMTPQEGFRFLRVKASVRNASQKSDKTYTLWAVEDVKRALAPILAKPEEHKGPYLWIDDAFVFLLTPASDLIACSHVCEGSELRRMGITAFDKNGKGRVICLPLIVDAGKDVGIDVIFSVPKGIEKYRLLVLGSAPVELTPGAQE